MRYTTLYQKEEPRTRDSIPEFVMKLCEQTIIIESRYDFEDLKENLWGSEYGEEWAWYKGLGKGTRRRLCRLLDHEIPIGLKYEDRCVETLDWQLSGEFLLALLVVIRRKDLVDSQPYYREGELFFAVEVDLS